MASDYMKYLDCSERAFILFVNHAVCSSALSDVIYCTIDFANYGHHEFFKIIKT